MTNEKKTNTAVLTPEFRVSFPEVFVPSAMDENQKKKYKLTMLFDTSKPEVKKWLDDMRKHAEKLAIDKWGLEKCKALKKEGKLVFPFKDGTTKEYEGYGEGIVFFTAASTTKPFVVNGRRENISEEEFYPGCYAHAKVNFFAYETKNNKGVVLKHGVSVGLGNVQKTRDGEPFANRSKPEDDFEVLDGGNTPEDYNEADNSSLLE